MDNIAETTALLSLLVRAMVSDREAVLVTAFPASGKPTVFQIQVGPKDRGKVIGKQGRTARSIRILLLAIAKENGCNYALDVMGFNMGPEQD